MTERWSKMVEKYVQDAAGFCRIVDPMDAVTLLTRQHRAFVRMVKKQPRFLVNRYAELEACVDGDLIEVSTLLAALVKQGGGKK